MKKNSKVANTGIEIQRVVGKLGDAAREQEKKSRAAEAVVGRDKIYVGIDLGDKTSNYCFLDAEANIVVERTPRSGLWWRWPANWEYCCTDCG